MWWELKYLPIVNVVFRTVSSIKTSNLSTSLLSYSCWSFFKKILLFGHPGLTQLIWLKCQFWGFINIFFQYAVKETGKVGTTTGGWLHSSGLTFGTSIFIHIHVTDDEWLWLRWESCQGAGGQRFVFWTMVLCLWARCRTPDYFQCGISSVLTDPSCMILSSGRYWTYLKILTNLIVNRRGFKTVLLVCWNKTCFSVTLSIYVAAACEDFTPCHGLTESLNSQSDWRQWGGDERRRLKGNKKSKRGEGGDFYSLSSMIDVRSIVEGKGRREGAEKSIREGEA